MESTCGKTRWPCSGSARRPRRKKELSSSQTTDINLPFITADATGAKHLQMSITRSEFERLVDNLIERCREPVVKALKDAKLNPSQIDEVVLVGARPACPRSRNWSGRSSTASLTRG